MRNTLHATRPTALGAHALALYSDRVCVCPAIVCFFGLFFAGAAGVSCACRGRVCASLRICMCVRICTCVGAHPLRQARMLSRPCSVSSVRVCVRGAVEHIQVSVIFFVCWATSATLRVVSAVYSLFAVCRLFSAWVYCLSLSLLLPPRARQR